VCFSGFGGELKAGVDGTENGTATCEFILLRDEWARTQLGDDRRAGS